MAAGGTLRLIEQVLSDGRVLDVSQAIADLNMLVLLPGKERTQSEVGALFEAAGFRLTRVLQTDSEMSIIEGKRLRGRR